MSNIFLRNALRRGEFVTAFTLCAVGCAAPTGIYGNTYLKKGSPFQSVLVMAPSVKYIVHCTLNLSSFGKIQNFKMKYNAFCSLSSLSRQQLMGNGQLASQ